MKKIVSTALVVMMLASLFAIPSFAADEFPSPGSEDYFTLTVSVKDNIGGTATASAATILKGETATITARADDGYSFAGWTFTGEFEWVSGDANASVITIRPKSDVAFVASFNGQGGPGRDTAGQSPAMGYNFEAVAAVMAAVVIMSAAAVVYTGKKYYFSAK